MSKRLLKAFNETTSIKLVNIEEAFFIKGQFKPINMFISGHAVDYEDRKVFPQDRIVLNLKTKEPKYIYKIGEIERFKEACEVINKMINNK